MTRHPGWVLLAVGGWSLAVLGGLAGLIVRRFDPAAYDAERTVAAFSERLRWETEMQRVTSDLAQTATEAVAPSTLTIWLRGNGSGR
jgi:hypothetical protein